MRTRAPLPLTLAALSVLVVLGAIAACGDDNAIKETVAKDSGVIDAEATVDGAALGEGGGLGPDGAILDDCVAKPDPNSYTDLLNACTDSYKLDPHPVLPLLFPDGGLPPLP